MSLNDKKIALITATDNGYAKGTAVMLYSFLKNNEWFEGDIIIIEKDLSASEKSKLSYLFDLTFVKPNPTLVERIHILNFFWPHAVRTEPRFYSLEAFSYSNYDHVFFLDSDLVVLRSLKELLVTSASYPLIAAPDKLWSQNMMRHYDSFRRVNKSDIENMNDYYHSFNSGLFVLNNQLLQEDQYEFLLKMLSPEVFIHNSTRHTDQFILNRRFHSEAKLISERYNFLIDENISSRDISDLVVLHFVEKIKPWNHSGPLTEYKKVWLDYYEAYQQFIEKHA